jgi:hypothetical protein
MAKKKYKYSGSAPEIEVPKYGIVKNGEVFEVEFEIKNPDFQEVTKEDHKKKEDK